MSRVRMPTNSLLLAMLGLLLAKMLVPALLSREVKRVSAGLSIGQPIGKALINGVYLRYSSLGRVPTSKCIYRAHTISSVP
jgi:hypothetical protein